MPASHNALKGIAFTICACACLALLDSVAKQVSLVMPVFMALWLRYLFQALLTTAYLLHSRGWKNTHTWRLPHTKHPRFQLLRAALLAASGLFAFLSVRFMPLAEFTAIVSAAPLCVTLVAALWLRQPVSRSDWPRQCAADFAPVGARPTGTKRQFWPVDLVAAAGLAGGSGRLPNFEQPDGARRKSTHYAVLYRLAGHDVYLCAGAFCLDRH